MPHLDLTQEELNRLHPSLVPPCDEQLEDLTNDADDAVYFKGLSVAEEIRGETSQQGRKRHPLFALLKKQQQHDESSSNRYRASTIRLLAGGVISGATTYPHTATDTTTTPLQALALGDGAPTPGAPPWSHPGGTTTTTASLATITDGRPRPTEAGRTVAGSRGAVRLGSGQLQAVSASLPFAQTLPQGV